MLRFVALGALVAGVLVVLASFALPLAIAVGLLAISAAAFVAVGYVSLRADRPLRDVPGARRSIGMSARVAIDEAVLAGQSLAESAPSSADLERIREKSLRLASFSNVEGGSGILVPTTASRRRSVPPDCRLGR